MLQSLSFVKPICTKVSSAVTLKVELVYVFYLRGWESLTIGRGWGGDGTLSITKV